MTGWVMVEIAGLCKERDLELLELLERERGGGVDRKKTSHSAKILITIIYIKFYLNTVPQDRRYLASATPGFAKSAWPGRASLFVAQFGACFPSTPSSGRGKIPTQLQIIQGGHGQHPSPTRAFVFSNYNLSGKLFKTGTEADQILLIYIGHFTNWR